jgi:hypothetical protein
MPLDKIRAAIRARKIEWKKHALKRLFERGIKRQDVFDAILAGEIIETYIEDRPFPSYLISGIGGEKQLHVVLALDEMEENAFIITVYIPSSLQWESDWKTRRGK